MNAGDNLEEPSRDSPCSAYPISLIPKTTPYDHLLREKNCTAAPEEAVGTWQDDASSSNDAARRLLVMGLLGFL